MPHRSVLLTFDDGEISQLNKAVPVLRELGAKGTFFVVGKHWKGTEESIPRGALEDSILHFSKVEYENSDCREIMEIGAHTYNLYYKVGNQYAINTISDSSFIDDLEKMKFEKFNSIAMPYGAYSKNKIEVLKKYYKCGFALPRRAFPYVSKLSNVYALPKIRIDGTMDGNILSKYL